MIDFGPTSNVMKGRGPRARVCYVCGKQVLIAGYDFHIQQCADLFMKREALKPLKERRKLPKDPYKGKVGDADISWTQLDALNAAATTAWSSNLLMCQWCDRKFLPDKLAMYIKSL